ncbi:MAG: 3-hydroxyacyl-CoA dehydrogenase [Betaproteobacteria bacterium]|nr:3-hydroxyacyl-CoA dehydrogenase [Betaproteobacteria bacterium]
MADALPRTADVGVIGAGAMGAGIAQIAAQAGHRVRLFDNRMGAADQAQAKIATTLAALAAKGKLAPADAEAAAARIVPVHALGDFVSAGLVIEAIVEDLDVKRRLLRELEVVVAPGAILATNTSSLSITALAAGLKRPGRVVGMHFFNPAPVLPLVEVVSGIATDAQVAAAVHATAAAWGKVPVHATSTPGFIVNRCARAFYSEALGLLWERAADAATIDAVMREAGAFRMGPFELMDMIGNDINFAVTKSVWEAYFHDPRFRPSVLQQERVAAGHLGRKTGRGYYDYGEGAVLPSPRTEPPAARPSRVTLAGASVLAEGLAARLRAAGLHVATSPADAALAPGHLVADGTLLVPCDGRTATAIAAACGHPDVVVFDLAFDYAKCARLAVAAADGCSPAAVAAVVGALQAAGMAVSRLDDVAGLPVMRTVAMLANEAADAVTQGIASARDVDLAMMRGVNYPRGPLAWADAIGVPHLRATLHHLAAHYGEDRYRLAPLIARRGATGGKLGE